MEEARLQITSGMRRILDYPKFTGPTRMLILETEYFFDRSWRRAGESLGWEVAGVPSVMTGGLTRDQVKDLFTAIGKFKPHFIITSNYAGMDAEGLFARFFEDAGIPYVSWFTDTPRMILYNRTVYCSHYSVAATWERAYEPQFRELGFEHVLFMPHAVDPGLFSGPPAETFDRHLAFVGASMIDHAAEAWDKLKDLPVVTAALEDAFARGAVTRDVAYAARRKSSTVMCWPNATPATGAILNSACYTRPRNACARIWRDVLTRWDWRFGVMSTGPVS